MLLPTDQENIGMYKVGDIVYYNNKDYFIYALVGRDNYKIVAVESVDLFGDPSKMFYSNGITVNIKVLSRKRPADEE